MSAPGKRCGCVLPDGCEVCDPAGEPRSIFGDHDGDFDAQDAAELEAEVAVAQFDNDPDIYAGTDDDGGFCGDDY